MTWRVNVPNARLSVIADGIAIYAATNLDTTDQRAALMGAMESVLRNAATLPDGRRSFQVSLIGLTVVLDAIKTGRYNAASNAAGWALAGWRQQSIAQIEWAIFTLARDPISLLGRLESSDELVIELSDVIALDAIALDEPAVEPP